jgi:hypothetical protein
MPPLQDQCAVDENGNLKDAKDIPWCFSPSSKAPMLLECQEGDLANAAGAAAFFCASPSLTLFTVQGRSSRNKNKRMLESIAQSRLDEFGNLEKKHRQPNVHSSKRPRKKRTRIADADCPVLGSGDDGEDDAYETTSNDGGSASSSEAELITDDNDNLLNDEVYISWNDLALLASDI